MAKIIEDKLRRDFLTSIKNFLTEQGEDVDFCIASDVGGIALNLPWAAEDGSEGWLKITAVIPKGTKTDPYEGYAQREDFLMREEARAEKAAKKAADKEKKMRQDEERRKKIAADKERNARRNSTATTGK